MNRAAATVLTGLDAAREEIENHYRDLHAHPELGMSEHRTAALAATALRDYGYDVTTGIAGTGVTGVLHNGPGPTVLLRADMDALPVKEATGLPYASTATVDRAGVEQPVMHACGHDVHVVCLLGSARLMAEARPAWHGTLIALFQPSEENGDGARAMVADGLTGKIPAPDVVLGQHVLPYPATAFGAASHTIEPQTASEDISEIPAAFGVPFTYWGLGGTDPAAFAGAVEKGTLFRDIPVNHSSRFAPVLQPTLDTGVTALVVAALAWLGTGEDAGNPPPGTGQPGRDMGRSAT
jgi:metal-dependent amidase/aminoacylase/carboxypeptidase family protein